MRLIFAGMLIIAGMIGIGLGGIAEGLGVVGKPLGSFPSSGYGAPSFLVGLVLIITGVVGAHREEKRLLQKEKHNKEQTR